MLNTIMCSLQLVLSIVTIVYLVKIWNKRETI